jgi:hypothetical protein
MVLGIIDAEFGMPREPFETDCEHADADMVDWQRAHAFVQRWVL